MRGRGEIAAAAATSNPHALTLADGSLPLLLPTNSAPLYAKAFGRKMDSQESPNDDYCQISIFPPTTPPTPLSAVFCISTWDIPVAVGSRSLFHYYQVTSQVATKICLKKLSPSSALFGGYLLSYWTKASLIVEFRACVHPHCVISPPVPE